MESTEKTKEMIRLSIFEVFEKMFYIFLEPDSVECPVYDMESLISFSGSIKGEVRLLLSEKIVNAMVRNMLDLEEEEITEGVLEDSSKEAVNMICGNFLAKLGKTDRFDLTIPVFLKPLESDPCQNDEVIRLNFVSDDGQVGLIMKLFQETRDQSSIVRNQ